MANVKLWMARFFVYCVLSLFVFLPLPLMSSVWLHLDGVTPSFGTRVVKLVAGVGAFAGIVTCLYVSVITVRLRNESDQLNLPLEKTDVLVYSWWQATFTVMALIVFWIAIGAIGNSVRA